MSKKWVKKNDVPKLNTDSYKKRREFQYFEKSFLDFSDGFFNYFCLTWRHLQYIRQKYNNNNLVLILFYAFLISFKLLQGPVSFLKMFRPLYSYLPLVFLRKFYKNKKRKKK